MASQDLVGSMSGRQHNRKDVRGDSCDHDFHGDPSSVISEVMIGTGTL